MASEPAFWPEAKPLQGRFVRLEPYADHLRDELRAALDTDPESWAVLASTGQGAGFDEWWRVAAAQSQDRTRLSYAVRRKSDGTLVGSTAFLNIRRKHRGLEIGGSFLRPEARSGPFNPEMKRLMLAHAFAAGAIRVELVTDARNLRSRAAILKLGAKAEGVLRRERINWTGHIRDTAVYSITNLDWPEVEIGLDRRLAAFA